MNELENFFNNDPWENITAPVYPNGQRLYQKDDRFWVSMDSSDRIIFFIRESGKYTIKKLPTLSGLEISIDYGTEGETRLICTLTEPLLRDKFSIVAKDVAHTSSKFQGDRFLEECKTRIISWADFLKPSRKGLTKPEWFGFWGELYILTQILVPATDSSDAIKFWIGPDGKKQDFTFNNTALEVKTTISGEPNSIKISSLDQLHKVTKKLYLLHLHINFSNDLMALSLRDMYEHMEDILKEDIDSRTRFLNKTSSLYGKASEEQLETKFNFIALESYDVKDGFPKLTNDSTHSAITSVKYDLNPSSLKSYLVELDIDELLNS
tara:strand:+ start:21 stop:989 length:969 start_codon:yes stop_codon:yes gene_type:complete